MQTQVMVRQLANNPPFEVIEFEVLVDAQNMGEFEIILAEERQTDAST